MNYKNIKIKAVAAMLCVLPALVFAGNEDRAGQAGATELLINPWARSSGWGNVNIAGVKGVDAMFLNIAGTAFTKSTDVSFSNTEWLSGSSIRINSLGLSQKVGESGALGLYVMSMNFGDIQITTTENPEGGIGTFSPQFINLGLSYSKAFSNSIYGGIQAKVISQSINDVKSQGFAFDAGIQYITGSNEDQDNLKFGISIKNVGAPMQFSGDGLSFRGIVPINGNSITVEQRAEKFELPSLVSMGVSYDIPLAEDHMIVAAGSFTSNSFSRDQFDIGVQYAFKKLFMLRGAYGIEAQTAQNDEDLDEVSALTGLSAGLTLQVPLGKSGKSFGIDYSYRASDPFDGSHSFGARLTL
ncbi:MAG: PorV/PorQ family protein [Bacteroidia bacterium]|nr:PorV/PorQ family protein [Bacteroidia bacterium]